MGRFPVTIGIAMLAAVAALASFLLASATPCFGLSAPPVAAWLQFDRSAHQAGQWWRLLTCHLTHWSAEHLLWDVLVFVVAGASCEIASRRRFVLAIVASAVLIPLSVWKLAPDLQTYRGLSGIDAALIVLLATTTIRAQWAQRRWAGAAGTVVLLGLFGAKTLYEQVTGQGMFVDAAAAGFVPVPLAHAVGAMAGLVAAVIPGRPRATVCPASPHRALVQQRAVGVDDADGDVRVGWVRRVERERGETELAAVRDAG